LPLFTSRFLLEAVPEGPPKKPQPVSAWSAKEKASRVSAASDVAANECGCAMQHAALGCGLRAAAQLLALLARGAIPRVLIGWVAPSLCARQIRYRDDQKVSTKGDKFIFVKVRSRPAQRCTLGCYMRQWSCACHPAPCLPSTLGLAVGDWVMVRATML
jgi:hypothetical protein